MESPLASKPLVCFEVEKVIGMSSDGSYRVQWAPAWVSKFHLIGCEHLIQEFLQRQANDNDSENEFLQRHTSDNGSKNELLQRQADDNVSKNVQQGDEMENGGVVTQSEVLSERRASNIESNHVPLLAPSQVYPSTRESPAMNQPAKQIPENDYKGNGDMDNYNIDNDSMDNGNPGSSENELNLRSPGHSSFQCKGDEEVSGELKESIEYSPDFLDIKVEEEECDSNSPEFLFVVYNQQNGSISDMGHTVLELPTSQVKELPPKKSYKCPLCRKHFPVKVALREHFRIHSCYRPYICPHCQTSFSRNVNLKRHLSAHNNEDLRRCSRCDKSFSRKDDMERHLCLHTGKKSYTCDTCGKSFGRLDHLKRHCVIHTGKKLLCTLCNKSYARKSSLDAHICNREGFKPYTCGVCKKKFSRTAALTKHMLTHEQQKDIF